VEYFRKKSALSDKKKSLCIGDLFEVVEAANRLIVFLRLLHGVLSEGVHLGEFSVGPKTFLKKSKMRKF